MYEFRMLNRRPLELPELDMEVAMVSITLHHYTNEQARERLRQMHPLLYNPYSGWYFALSGLGIGKLPNETYITRHLIDHTIHLSAVANLDKLIKNAVLGYSKIEPKTRVNSNKEHIPGNADIKAVHRFYTGAWIDQKPYSVRLLIQEFHDGRVKLGEEAKAYALNLKEMRGISVGDSSVPPASHGLTKPSPETLPLESDISGNISVSSSRCGAMPPTDASLMGTKIEQIPHITKIPLQHLIESNLKEGEEPLYQQRAAFDYSKTGTDRVETIFDRLRLTDEERQQLYAGEAITVHNIKIRTNKMDATLS
ncbi:MAG: hypothetical protein K2I84_02310, partial [Bacteroidales bacterium]|nr:hypothetical protein [Bacteroidales bacterium]